ncbi:MAG: tetratricopeptide repeat protein [Desulfobacterales bacterium]|nr:MAG: tetratricopeptide repeat protein [Desulfobacterales bacterium]
MLNKKTILLVVLLFGCVTALGCGGELQKQMKLAKAKQNLSSEKYDDAIAIYTEYLAENPNATKARSRLGFAYLKSGRLDQAIAAFTTVLKAEPGEPYSILYLGLAYLNKGQYGETVKIWQTYRNKKEPLVESEIKRLLTLVIIAESQRLAKTAMAEEGELTTIKLAANTVAVCYYKDLSPDKSMRAFQKGLAAMVLTDMAKIKSLKVVERLRLQALLEEMNLGKTGIVDENTAPKVGRLVGADNLIVGNLTWGINAATAVASTDAAAVKGSAVCSEKRENFFKLPCCIVQEAANILRISLSPKERGDTCIPHTKNYNAFIYFGEGLDAFDAGKWQEAKNLFEKALKEDPLFELARIWADGCPEPNSPTSNELKHMKAHEIATHAESAIDGAMVKQRAATAAQETPGSGGSGH